MVGIQANIGRIQPNNRSVVIVPEDGFLWETRPIVVRILSHNAGVEGSSPSPAIAEALAFNGLAAFVVRGSLGCRSTPPKESTQELSGVTPSTSSRRRCPAVYRVRRTSASGASPSPPAVRL